MSYWQRVTFSSETFQYGFSHALQLHRLRLINTYKTGNKCASADKLAGKPQYAVCNRLKQAVW